MANRPKRQNIIPRQQTVKFSVLFHENPNLAYTKFTKIASELKQCCGIEIIKDDYKDTSTSVTLSEQLFFKIQCIAQCHQFPNENSQAYNAFQNYFLKIVSKVTPKKSNSPWLNFKSNNAYPRYFKSAHENVKITNIKIGSLISSSHFVGHFSREVRNVNFLHDKQKVVVDDQLEIRYASLKNILVNGNQWVLHISNPPVVYQTKTNTIKYPTHDFNNFIFGRCNAILITFNNAYEASQILSRLYYCCQNSGSEIISYVNLQVTTKKVPNCLPNFDFGSYEINYLIEAIVRRSFAPELQDFQKFETTVQNLKLQNSPVLIEALKDLIHIMDTGIILNYQRALQLSFERKMSYTKNDTSIMDIIPKKAKQVRRAVITPTRILLYPPELIITNRVIRNFHIDSALRVSFRDDSLNKLNQSSGKYLRRDVIFKTINGIANGLSIAKRNFKFLGWSNSQIRDHGLWMYAKDPKGETAMSIQRWMGDFSNIKVVAKFAARMGQCFSQTEETVAVPLTEGRVKMEEDIKGIELDPESKEPYVFSDGIGKISLDLAKNVCETLGVTKICSAYQIRYSGYKGMLVVDPTLKDHDIVFRNSMKKFECTTSQTLEIVKISQACNLSLNRPLITILDQMGIEHSVFLKMQNERLQLLTDILLDDSKAVSYLKRHHNIPNIQFDEFITSGIFPTVEPFFHAMLVNGHKLDIAQIMKKAKIPINPADGRNMFGVIDELGVLNYGEVFVQYTTNLIGQETNMETTVVKGNVLVTKNPCYQPGDVRILNAVDVPELHHIVDCIVFPQKGKRPHPSEMSGSDLDGDEFAVIWKEDFIFKKGNARPRHCPVPDKKDITTDVTTRDLLKFFSMFILNDRIGPLASAHLATADSLGLHHPQCVLLARSCSIAVDFSKSGVAKELEEPFSVKWYPDFMEKWDKSNYVSKRALGKLYRNCLGYARGNSKTCGHYENVQVDPLLTYPGWEKYKSTAIKSRDKYNSLLESILNNYGVSHESQVMTGMYDALNGRFGVKNGRNEVEELLKILVQSLFHCFKRDFESSFETASSVDVEEVKKKASAWYVVTYSEKNPRFLSFPWVVTNHLLCIKYANIIEKQLKLSEKPVIGQLESIIESELEKVNALPAKYSSFKTYTLKKAEILIKKWAMFNNFKPDEVLKLFNASINIDLYSNCESITLVLDFFKYINDLSIEDETYIKEKLNSCQCELKWETMQYISRAATYTYKQIAIEKDFNPFGLSRAVTGSTFTNKSNYVEMEPRSISDEVLEYCNLESLSKFFKVRSRVDNIEIRLEDGKILVSAIGTPAAIDGLEGLIKRGSGWLKRCLTTQNQ